MASRFYFHASGAIATPNNPGFDANWEQTGQATRLPMDLKTRQGPQTALANSSAITIPITTTQDILCYQFTSNQTFKPAKLDASILFSMVIRALENATTNNAFLAYSLRAFDVRGSASLGTLSSNFAGGGTEYAASAQTRIFAATAITATQIDQLFRLVLEIGSHVTGPTAAGSYTMRAGTNAASDFALTSGLTTDLNPWFELSRNLNATGFQNYMSAGGEGSVAEKLR